MKFGSTFLRVVQREISLQIGGKFMQLLMNRSLDLSKFCFRDKNAGKRIYDTSTNRSRKYKRSASFNSRRVFLLFSVVSIMGTMILIYLTLRVRQITDAAAICRSLIDLKNTPIREERWWCVGAEAGWGDERIGGGGMLGWREGGSIAGAVVWLRMLGRRGWWCGRAEAGWEGYLGYG
ncbi:hypothetical protein Leryth_000454 [Lithospermum erythrorhizon]|nr:hypothetical protein Leryth_000454 [Lithospermum erythrorhizon]